MKKTFSIKQAFSFGLETFKKRPVFYIILPFLPAIVGIIISFVSTILGAVVVNIGNGNTGTLLQSIVTIALQILSWVISTLLTLGLSAGFLAAVEGKEFAWKDITKYGYAFIPFLLANILIGFVSIFAFLLFIVPGILWLLATEFYTYTVLSKGKGPMEAIKDSMKITSGARMHLFLFGLAVVFVNFIGAICLGIGLLITIPVTGLATAYIYMKLKEQTDGILAAKSVSVVETPAG